MGNGAAFAATAPILDSTIRSQAIRFYLTPPLRCVIINASQIGRFRIPTPFHWPVPPGGAEEINPVVARVRQDGKVAYFASGVPLFVHGQNDAVGQRLAAVQLLALG